MCRLLFSTMSKIKATMLRGAALPMKIKLSERLNRTKKGQMWGGRGVVPDEYLRCVLKYITNIINIVINVLLSISIIFVDVKSPMESGYMILSGFGLVFAVLFVAAVITYSKKSRRSQNGTLQSLEGMLVTVCRYGHASTYNYACWDVNVALYLCATK